VLVLNQDEALFGRAIAIAIAQQGEPIGGFAVRSGPLHQLLPDPADQPATRVG
jgi:hypothetical protein